MVEERGKNRRIFFRKSACFFYNGLAFAGIDISATNDPLAK
jgi:hypothetical protein